MADMTKVPFTEEELAAVKEASKIYEAVAEQLSDEDEDPGVIDFDDGIEIATKSWAGALALQRYIFGGATTRERIARTKYILDGVERALDLISPDPPRPGVGSTSNPAG